MSLRLVAVSKSFGRHQALDDVSLHVRRGDCYGFLGHNGAGKTTALRIALGLIPLDRGRIIVDGFDARQLPREARARQGGLIERPGFYSWLSGRRNLQLLAHLQGLSRTDSRRRVDELLETVGLAYASGRRVGGYSQGMRQRLGIALALVGNPSLVLLDEPMNGLDPAGIEEFRRLLMRMTREEGRTVVLSSHQLHDVSDVCNRIGIVHQGRMVVEAETQTLLAGSGSRHHLKTSDDRAAAGALQTLGIETSPHSPSGLEFDAGSVPAGRIVRQLVDQGVDVLELAPEVMTLEQIYLQVVRGGDAAPSVPTDAVSITTAPPTSRQAPSRPMLRAFRVETSQIASHITAWAPLGLPAALAVLSILVLWGKSRGHLTEMESGQLYSHTLVTAFEGVTVGLRDALPLAALICAALASQSLAGEESRGTLRNLLMCPVGRGNLGVGKGIGVLAVAAVCYGFMLIAAIGASAMVFDFTDVVEQLEIKGTDPFVITEAAALWPPFMKMLPALLLPLLAYTGLGFLAGALVRHGVTALALAVGLVVFLDLFRVAGREFGFEPALCSAHLPSPLGDTSWTAHVLRLIRAPNDPPGGMLILGLIVPLIWLTVSILLATLLLSRRSVP